MVSCQCRLEKARRRHAENGLCANAACALFSERTASAPLPVRVGVTLFFNPTGINVTLVELMETLWTRFSGAISSAKTIVFHQPFKTYPTPRTVWMRRGVLGESSIFSLRYRTYTSMIFVSPRKS